MAGGGGSTGGIGAQSPASGGFGGGMGGGNMGGGFGGNMGNASAGGFGGGYGGGYGNNSQLGQLGSMANAAGVPNDLPLMHGGPHVGGGFGGSMGGEYSPNPMGGFGGNLGGGYDGGNMLSNMGNNARLGNNMGNMPGNYGFGNIARPPAQSYDQYLAGRGPMQQQMQRQYAQPGQDYRTVSPQQVDQMRGLSQQMDSYMQGAPAYQQLQDLQTKMQGGQMSPQDYQQQAEALNTQMRDYQQNAPMMPQIQALQQPQAMQQAQAMQQQGGMGRQPTGQMAGLGALLGGMPNQPTPTAPPVAARPAPTRAAPARSSFMGRGSAPSVVPPKTPPAVASAIQKLAAKKQNRR